MLANLPADNANYQHDSSKLQHLLLSYKTRLSAKDSHEEEEQEGKGKGGLNQEQRGGMATPGDGKG